MLEPEWLTGLASVPSWFDKSGHQVRNKPSIITDGYWKTYMSETYKQKNHFAFRQTCCWSEKAIGVGLYAAGNGFNEFDQGQCNESPRDNG